MAVVLADILNEKQVTLTLRARTRRDALREIVWTMTTEGGVTEPEKFLTEVQMREGVGTTFMGNGVAFPHARTDLVQQIVLGIGRSADGVPYGDEGTRAHLIFLIGVPKRMVTDYLVCVGALARLAKDEETRGTLMRAETPAEFMELLHTGSLSPD